MGTALPQGIIIPENWVPPFPWGLIRGGNCFWQIAWKHDFDKSHLCLVLQKYEPGAAVVPYGDSLAAGHYRGKELDTYRFMGAHTRGNFFGRLPNLPKINYVDSSRSIRLGQTRFYVATAFLQGINWPGKLGVFCFMGADTRG